MINDNTTKTILLVEDEAIISIVITKTLKRFGYNVLNAGSGEKAVELSFSNDTIDLVLMDIDLGSGIDGTEAAKQILAFREVPIVFHTSHSEQEMVDRVRGITRYGYVIKSSGDFVLQSSIEMAFELVAAHKRVKASEEHFYGLFDKAPLGYQSLDEEGHFVEVNEKWLETLGYDRDEVMGKWFGDFLAPEFVEAFRERFPMFKAAGKIHSEFQMMHKCGERRFIAFEGRIGYKTDGSFQQTHCILSDITEQKRAETELYRTKAILQAAMDQSPAGIAIADASDGKLRYVNDAGLLIRGGDRQELVDGVGIDKYVTSWQILDLDGSPLETDKVPLARAVLYGDINSREFIIRRSIGEDRIVLANAAPIRDENGNIEAGMVVFSDITERVLAERDLKNKNEELTALNGKLKIAVEELEATNEELNASMEEMEATNEELYAINELVIEAERKLEISESLFRGLYDSMTSGSAIYTVINDGSRGADYIVKNFNKSGLKIEGKTIEDVVGRSLLDLRPEIDSYGLIPVLKKVWDTGEPDFFPVKIYKDDKFSNYFDNYVFKLPSGEVVTLYNDVTDQKLAEENLRESEEQFRSLAESSTDYIMVYDKDTRHTYANKATLTVSGKTWDEFVGKTHREMGFDPDLVELWEEKIQKVFDTGESQGEIFEWEGAEGKTVLDWRVNPIFAKDGTVSNVLGVSRDISALKQAEESLRKSEERFSRALAAVDDGIWDWNTSDGSAFFNTECYNLLGYSDGEFSASYDSWRTLVHPDDIDRVEEDLKNSIGSGIKFDIDLRMKRKSGEWLWVCTRGKAVEWDSEGRTLRMIGTLSDVTLRKKTEFELRESQNNLTRIIENSSELICEIDDTGRYTFVSKRYEDILGYSPDELLGQLVSEKMHPDDLTAAAAKHETVKSEKGISVDEWRFRHKNGSYHTFQCRGSVYIDVNGSPKTVVVAHDITESKQMDETQLFLIMSGSHLSGGDDFFQSLARYLAETLKMDFVCIDKLVGGGLSARTVAVYFDGEFEDNIEYTLNDTPCGVVAGKNICTFEENVRGLFPKDIVLQEMKAESYAGVTLWGSSGEPIGLIAVIGREKMDDPALAESILKMVSIRAAGELERRDAEERIKGLLLEKDILLKEVHHRIKNNMNTINGLLSLQAESLTDPAAVDALKDAESRVQSMMVLYDKLYRSDNFNEVSISEYLPGLIAEITENFPNKKSVQIESSIDDFILGVQTLLPIGIIVNELITNTMKYAFAGRDGGSIKISAILKGSKAEMIIEDNGVGIPETVTFENSFGFGMQLVCMLTEQMGGAIRIERGEGTRFVLEFDVCT